MEAGRVANWFIEFTYKGQTVRKTSGVPMGQPGGAGRSQGNRGALARGDRRAGEVGSHPGDAGCHDDPLLPCGDQAQRQRRLQP